MRRDPSVVLATVSFSTSTAPPSGTVPVPPVQISCADRRVLLATQRLQVATLCLP